MKVFEIISILEKIAATTYQENYDNAGLIVGNNNQEIESVLICLDSTLDVVQEAIDTKSNLIIAHHPIVFSGLKRFNSSNYVEKAIELAIKNDIAIYAIHTNLDNVLLNGVNERIAHQIGLTNLKILRPKTNQLKKITFISSPMVSGEIQNKLIELGAGQLNPKPAELFSSVGAYMLEGQNLPVVKVEMLAANHVIPSAIQYLNSKMVDIVYEISTVENLHPNLGSGIIGELENEMPIFDFLKEIKSKMNVGCVKFTKPVRENIKRVALCGGSGSFLLNDAIKQNSDLYISSDFKYHEFFDANDRIVIADIGHFESEQYTIRLLFDIISNKLPNFAVNMTKIRTNPVFYL